jgi:hypothetical protein
MPRSLVKKGQTYRDKETDQTLKVIHVGLTGTIICQRGNGVAYFKDADDFLPYHEKVKS